MNLMLNGIEAMKETGGVLTVKIASGPGRPSADLSQRHRYRTAGRKADQIFNAFFTTKPQGSGMGLAISRSIIESHRGRLWATPTTDGARHFISPCQLQPKPCKCPAQERDSGHHPRRNQIHNPSKETT